MPGLTAFKNKLFMRAEGTTKKPAKCHTALQNLDARLFIYIGQAQN